MLDLGKGNENEWAAETSFSILRLLSRRVQDKSARVKCSSNFKYKKNLICLKHKPHSVLEIIDRLPMILEQP